jgi:hypothetical protein
MHRIVEDMKDVEFLENCVRSGACTLDAVILLTPGSMKGMVDPITIEGEFRATWRNYSAFPEKDSEFRYLLFEVK